MKKQRWALKYRTLYGAEKTCHPRSEEKKNEQLAKAKEIGIEVISCKKLYPFNVEANQHNFDLISTICYNAMFDMQTGEVEWDNAEYDRLGALKEKAERFLCLPLPTAWLPYEDWKDAKELANMAIMHRQDACIRNGHPDLVTYC